MNTVIRVTTGVCVVFLELASKGTVLRGASNAPASRVVEMHPCNVPIMLRMINTKGAVSRHAWAAAGHERRCVNWPGSLD